MKNHGTESNASIARLMFKKHFKSCLWPVCFVFFAWWHTGTHLHGAEPQAVPTYHCLSLYWSPQNNSGGAPVSVKYRVAGESVWQSGLGMKYHPVSSGTGSPKPDYRGSIVNLQPDTTYEIALEVGTGGETASITATTRSETAPEASTIFVSSRTGNNPVTITTSGTDRGYIVYDGTGQTIDMNNLADNGIIIDASYVILRGFTVRNVKKHGIRIAGGHHIVIEKCDISGWGEHDENGYGFDLQMGITGTNPATHAVTVQRCKIHHPNWDTNAWGEIHDGSPHPAGPQGLGFANSAGGNVIRYNEIWSDEDHYFNDAIGFGSNASFDGFPGPDSDIYGNYVANAHDDGIEAEGGNRNVRIWNNYLEEVYIAIGNAPTSIGPLYVWRNVTGATDLYFAKMGFSTSITWMTGHMYFFNNTVWQSGNNDGGGGLGASGGGQRDIFHCVSRNNILHGKSTDAYSISSKATNADYDYDYDLLSDAFPLGQEIHGISGTPTYASATPFSVGTKTGNFQLAASSLGYDAGTVIPNFCETFSGAAPDIGAHESGNSSFVYGMNAGFSPPVNNSVPLVTAAPAIQNARPLHAVDLSGTASWVTSGSIGVTWSKVSGPGAVGFDDASAFSTTAMFAVSGTYVLSFTASDSLVSGTANATVVVKDNDGPVVSISPSTLTSGTSVFLQGSVVDDNLPEKRLELQWSKVSGPGTVSFNDPDLPGTMTTFSATGAYVVALVASDTIASGTATATITVKNNAPPVVASWSPSQPINISQAATFSGTASDDGLPNGQLTLVWEKKNGPGTVTFTSTNSLNTQATFSTTGTYSIRFKAFDSELYGSSLSTVIVQ